MKEKKFVHTDKKKFKTDKKKGGVQPQANETDMIEFIGPVVQFLRHSILALHAHTHPTPRPKKKACLCASATYHTVSA